jgi:FG-GAP-like repeat
MRAGGGSILALVALSVLGGAIQAMQNVPGAAPAAPAAAGQGQTEVATEAEARAACVPCHAYPPPDVLPRAAWRDEVARMSLIRSNLPQPSGPMGTAARMIVLPPDFARVLRYYQANAPEKLAAPAAWPAANALTFVKRTLNPTSAPEGPAISNVRLLDVDGDGRLELLATDMRFGLVMMGRPYEAGTTLDVIAQLSNPSHISMVDFDRDGLKDFFVADLGEYLPSDHTRGSFVLLRGTREGKYQQLELDRWPRIADVETADFNGDGTEDVAVAAFGWRKVGNLSLLENHTTTDYSHPSFVPRVVDPRPGAIHAIPTDLNKDGKPDLVALFAQQFESVVAFINNGTSEVGFTPTVLYSAPHPNWGSSGIQLDDLDMDGDQDVILTHGDTLDDTIIKPYHGIQWLENKGNLTFVEHTLADLPGAHRAQAVDLDGDGDMDVVACALVANGSDVDETKLPALIWLEQTSPGVFERHTLEMGPPRHATLDAADVDRDGDVDLVVGNFDFNGRANRRPWIEYWENRRIAAGSTR